MTDHSEFSFLRCLDMSPSEAHTIHFSSLMQRHLQSLDEEAKLKEEISYVS